jgi:hypothetical protein
VIDDVTKECLAAVADTSISGKRVARELTALLARRGRPGMIVSDHGTEFTSNAVLGWTSENRIAWHFIAPGKPMQNGPCFASSQWGSGNARVGCVHVCGLLLRPMIMTAGPDGVRGSKPHQRVALLAPKALRALSIPGPTGGAITSLLPSQPLKRFLVSQPMPSRR